VSLDASSSSWRFVSNHARVLVCLANDPGARLRDLALALAITDRRVFDIVNELAAAGFVTKTRAGRRNRYEVQADAIWTEVDGRERSVGDLVDFLVGNSVPRRLT
jgi:predicted MarR family transcription regulator